MRAKKSASFFVKELVKNYLDRQAAVSDPYYLDLEIELSFLKGFLFKDTSDQSSSWKEIKKDLLSKTPMDRLLCGDVGFGKTELAIRACFVAAVNGRGAIVLAPTTILAKQLFLSFSRNFLFLSSCNFIKLLRNFFSSKQSCFS